MNQIKVLLVDDEEELVSAWVERFTLRGIDAEGVTTGNDAIRIVGEKHFDVVVLDIKMPGIDGFEIMKQIKGIKPCLPVIFISGYESIDDIDNGQLAVSYDSLVKPVNIEVLIEKIKEAVKS